MKRILAVLLAALMLSLPAAAAEADWLIPPIRDYAPFTDTAGTICEEAAGICCRVGLMDGVDSRHFYPTSGLTHAQIIVVSARLHRLLSGGSLEYFESISLTGADWWKPYDGYLREMLPALAQDSVYTAAVEAPTIGCSRGTFLTLLSAVLTGTGTTLPEINDVSAVPDCQDPAWMAFYRWGVLGGKDAYGTLEANAPLSRAAAAAMLARLIDPDQRLTLTLQPLDLCQELLGVSPETALMTIGDTTVTAELFVPTLVSICSGYNHSHFGSMGLEMSGRTVTDEAVDTLRKYVRAETLAPELGLETTAPDTAFADGYRGLTAAGQTWQDAHIRLTDAIIQALGSFPGEDLPPVTYTPAWETLDLSNISARVAQLPYWGGTF